MSTLKTVLQEAFKDLRIDPALFSQIHQYSAAFVNRNDDHIRFFGGNLLGVYPVRFKSSDKNEWLDDILHIDESDTREAILRLPSIKENWIRATDVMNLSCLYLVHAIKVIYQSKLSPIERERVMIDVLMVLHYKFFGSILAHYFKYPADEATALATYAALSKKFAIKQYGNWYAVLENRCKDIIAENSIHFETIARFDDDEAIIYMITDTQGRLKSIVKKIWAVFEVVRQQNAKILTAGGTIELDGKTIVRDVSRMYTPYRRYLGEIVSERNRFIKPELVEVIGSAMHTMPEKLLTDVLSYMVDHYQDKRITALLDETMLHAFDYLSNDRRAQDRMNDIAALIAKLRALYMASRSTDPALMKMRELGESIVHSAVVGRSAAVVASVRTGLLLYIVLRTFTMKHYG